jgi:hypothetical protein
MSDYKLYSKGVKDGWVYVEIVAENPQAKQNAINKFLSEWRVYDAKLDHETGLTAVMKRFYKQ